MKRLEIITLALVIAVFLLGLLTGSVGLLTISLLGFPIVLLFFLRNKPARWFWILFIVLILTHGIQVNNPFVEDVRTVSYLAALIFAIRRSFFVKGIVKK